MQRLAASAATTVLPAPTSPCSKRCMGTFLTKSASISRPTRCWAAVNLKGRLCNSCVCSDGRRAPRNTDPFSAGARIAARTRRACNCEICCASNSSAFKRCQAGWLRSSSVCSATSGVGWCKNCSASRRLDKRCGMFWLKNGAGMVSLRSARASPLNTALRKYTCGKPAEVGYTGVKAPGNSPPASLKCGCIISRPRKPPRNSPRTRTRAPTLRVFWCDG